MHADLVFDDDGEPIKLAGTAQDVSERKVAEAEIRFLAYHDSLTRLGNRRLFRERLGFALAQARRNQTIVGVMFLDLDNFKRINDTLGHSAGDELLKEVAERLTRSVRETDCVSRSLEDESALTVSRFGGDEFMISLTSVRTTEEIAKVALRIREALTAPLQLEGQEVVVSASLGIAVAPKDGGDVDELLRNADAAMYAAKQQARGSYAFYEPSMSGHEKKDLELESDLRQAIEQGQLSVNYQPKVALATGVITGFEALVRWQHPLLGAIPPSEFIPLAEQAGLIVSLGEFVLRSVCSQVNIWSESGLPPLRISVNLSAYQLRTREIVNTVTDILEETRVSPGLLDVEFTESSMMENRQVGVDIFQRLRGVGITVSLDDFGTGHSSLSFLKGFPVDTLKIDCSFVSELSDPDYAAITAAIISMAKALNLRTIAEGVETEEQLAFLRANGCDEMQGYLFSRPLSVADATQLQWDLVNGISTCRLPEPST